MCAIYIGPFLITAIAIANDFWPRIILRYSAETYICRIICVCVCLFVRVFAEKIFRAIIIRLYKFFFFFFFLFIVVEFVWHLVSRIFRWSARMLYDDHVEISVPVCVIKYYNNNFLLFVYMSIFFFFLFFFFFFFIPAWLLFSVIRRNCSDV